MFEVIAGRKVHPVASIFPMMGEGDLRALADDIAENGQRELVVVAWADESKSETVLIDGRNRSRACELLGIDPDVELFSQEFIPMADFARMIVSWNLHRRHLSASQRAMVAVEFEKVFAEEAKKRQVEAGEKFGRGKVQENLPEPIGPSPQATDEAGDLFNVSGRTVRDAKYVADNDPELAEKVKTNEISASAAAKQLRQNGKPELTEAELAKRDAKRLARKGGAYLQALMLALAEIIGEEINGNIT